MFNFTFHNPVKIVFGRGQIAALDHEVPKGARVLMLFGGGSIFKNGVHAQVVAALKGRPLVEFGGIGPNPEYETLLRAVALGRKEEVDFLLAVGGGSVLDGAKLVALAIPYEGDPWDLVARKRRPKAALPLGCVLTLPATGSEMNPYAVISRAATGEKLSFGSDRVFPRFSILDPETTFSLPPRQIANGVVDAFVHTTEQYLTFPADAPLQDRFAEGLLRTLIEEGPKTLADPTAYEPRANVMWCATMALNGLLGCGVPQDWATHAIGHELTALKGLDHAQTLALVLPHLLRVQKEAKAAKLLQFAERVWEVNSGTEPERIEAGIQRTADFFERMGNPTRLGTYGLGSDLVEAVTARLAARGALPLGEGEGLGESQVIRILKDAL
jgi:NADP-dependent alcohol dehydrogenase